MNAVPNPTFKTFLNEASLARVFDHTQNNNIGIITAHRAELSAEENASRHAELKSKIRAAKFGHLNINGRYTENKGTSEERTVDERYLIVTGPKKNSGNLLGHLEKWGEEYQQDSILHKAIGENAKLHGTREGAWPGKGEIYDIGEWHANTLANIRNVMNGDRSFNFESIQFRNSQSWFSSFSPQPESEF